MLVFLMKNHIVDHYFINLFKKCIPIWVENMYNVKLLNFMAILFLHDKGSGSNFYPYFCENTMPKNLRPRLQDKDKGLIPSAFRVLPFTVITDDNVYGTPWGKSAYHLTQSNKGMWVMSFTAGSAALDAAWKKVEKGIEDGVFMEAQFSRKYENSSEQLLVVSSYDYRDKFDVHFIHEEITKRGISRGANNQDNLKYITDTQFAILKQPSIKDNTEVLYTSKSIKEPPYRIEAFKQRLEGYIKDRRNLQATESCMFKMFSKLKIVKMTAVLKISAAEAMLEAINNPQKRVRFTQDQIEALSHDTLGGIKDTFQDVLPQQFRDAVKQVDALQLNRARW